MLMTLFKWQAKILNKLYKTQRYDKLISLKLTNPQQIDYSIFFDITPGINKQQRQKMIQAANRLCRPLTRAKVMQDQVKYFNQFIKVIFKQNDIGNITKNNKDNSQIQNNTTIFKQKQSLNFNVQHVIVYSSLSKCRIWPKILKQGIGLVPSLIHFYNKFTKEYNDCLDFKFDPVILTQKYTKIMKKVNMKKKDHPKLVQAIKKNDIQEVKRIIDGLQQQAKSKRQLNTQNKQKSQTKISQPTQLSQTLPPPKNQPQPQQNLKSQIINNIIHKNLSISHICIQHSNLQTIKYLSSIGLNFQQLDDQQQTSLFYAIKRRDMEIIKYLIQQIKVNINHKQYQDRTAFYLASFEGELQIVNYLYLKGANPQIPSKLDRTPLSKACYLGNVDVVKYLLSIKVDMLKQDNKGRTALHNAAWGIQGGRDGKRRGHVMLQDSPQSVQLLLNAGHPVDLQDYDGFTAFFSAVSSMGIRSMRLLIQRGTNLYHITKNKQTACFIAAKYGHLPVLKILIQQHGLNYTEPDYHGYSPLCASITQEQPDVFIYLADLYAKNGIVMDIGKIVECCRQYQTVENICYLEKWMFHKDSDKDKDNDKEMNIKDYDKNKNKQDKADSKSAQINKINTVKKQRLLYLANQLPNFTKILATLKKQKRTIKQQIQLSRKVKAQEHKEHRIRYQKSKSKQKQISKQRQKQRQRQKDQSTTTTTNTTIVTLDQQKRRQSPTLTTITNKNTININIQIDNENENENNKHQLNKQHLQQKQKQQRYRIFDKLIQKKLEQQQQTQDKQYQYQYQYQSSHPNNSISNPKKQLKLNITQLNTIKIDRLKQLDIIRKLFDYILYITSQIIIQIQQYKINTNYLNNTNINTNNNTQIKQIIKYTQKQYNSLVIQILSECIHVFNKFKSCRFQNIIDTIVKLSKIVMPINTTIPPFYLHIEDNINKQGNKQKNSKQLNKQLNKQQNKQLNNTNNNNTKQQQQYKQLYKHIASTNSISLQHFCKLKLNPNQSQSDLIKLLTNRNVITNLTNNLNNITDTLFKLTKYRKTGVIIAIFNQGKGLGKYGYDQILDIVSGKRDEEEEVEKGKEQKEQKDNEEKQQQSQQEQVNNTTQQQQTKNQTTPNNSTSSKTNTNNNTKISQQQQPTPLKQQKLSLIQYCLLHGISDIAVYLQQICKSPNIQSLVTIPKYQIKRYMLSQEEINIDLESVEEWVFSLQDVVSRMGKKQYEVYRRFVESEGRQKRKEQQGKQKQGQIQKQTQKSSIPKFQPSNNYYLIDTYQKLQSLQKILQQSILIGIDTQHYNISKQQYFICSIQISNGQGSYIIDTLSHLKNQNNKQQSKLTTNMISKFIQKLMGDSKKIKIFHAYQNDVKWLHQDFNLHPDIKNINQKIKQSMYKNSNVIDTCKIYNLINKVKKGQSVGLKTLCEKYLGHDMLKDFQRSDWRIRPLFKEMIQYAAIDAEVLPYIYLRMLGSIQGTELKQKLKQGFIRKNMKSRGVRNKLEAIDEDKKDKNVNLINQMIEQKKQSLQMQE